MDQNRPPVVVALPIADRPRAMVFYRDAFGLDAFGEPAADGVPEPLQFHIGDGVVLMLVPADGFGGILLPGREIAAPGVSECIVGLPFADERSLVDAVDRVRNGGGTIVAEPEGRPWGFTAVVTDLDGHAWQLMVHPGGRRDDGPVTGA